jgi:hypothetical protein
MFICVLKKITIKEVLKIDIKNKVICIDFKDNYTHFMDRNETEKFDFFKIIYKLSL